MQLKSMLLVAGLLFSTASFARIQIGTCQSTYDSIDFEIGVHGEQQAWHNAPSGRYYLGYAQLTTNPRVTAFVSGGHVYYWTERSHMDYYSNGRFIRRFFCR